MNKLKSRFLEGQRLNGCWLEMANCIAAEVVALSGYDTVVVDCEHGPNSYTDAIQAMQAARFPHCSPVIRASSTSDVDIKRALDLGPMALVVPNVRNAQEAKDVVSACHYGPRGTRGAAARIIRASDYGNNVAAYLEFMDNEFVLMAQIESTSAVDDIDAIAATPGVDMLFIGPSDLSASLGDMGNFTSDGFCAAMAAIETAAKKHNKLLGSIVFGPYSAADLFERGYQYLISGTDLLLLQHAADANIAQMKAAAKV